MDALIIVDVTNRDRWRDALEQDVRAKTDIACAMQNVLAEWRRKQDGIIVFVVFPGNQHPDSQTSDAAFCLGCNRPECRLADFLNHRHGSAYEPVFSKPCYDAFSNPALAQFLREKGVTWVFLAGSMRAVCVKDTACGAVQNGFAVVCLKACVYDRFCDERDIEWWVKDVKSESALSVQVL